MTIVYCPLKDCWHNGAGGDSTKEGICWKYELELNYVGVFEHVFCSNYEKEAE